MENGPLNSRNSYGKAWFDREHDAWYAGYWCKAGRQDSRKAHEKRLRALVSGGLTHEDAAAFLVRMAAEDRASFEGTADWSWRAKLHPATWLNGERWTDQAVTSKGPVIPAARGKDFMADVANVIGGRIARGDEPW